MFSQLGGPAQPSTVRRTGHDGSHGGGHSRQQVRRHGRCLGVVQVTGVCVRSATWTILEGSQVELVGLAAHLCDSATCCRALMTVAY